MVDTTAWSDVEFVHLLSTYVQYKVDWGVAGFYKLGIIPYNPNNVPISSLSYSEPFSNNNSTEVLDYLLIINSLDTKTTEATHSSTTDSLL